MGAGYTRQALANIANGLTIFAADINNELNAIQSAYNGTTGHAHDGSIGNGPKINLTTSITGILPTANGGSGGINNYSAVTAPTINSDNTQGYVVGSEWINTATSDLYQCINASTGAAVWQRIENYNANLASIASLTMTTNSLAYATGAATFAVTTFSPLAQTLLSNTTTTAMQTTLALVIGTNVQAQSVNLQALSSYNTNGILVQTAANTFAGRVLTGTGSQITVTNGDGVAGNPTISLPASMTMTGITLTGGTYSSPTINNPTVSSPTVTGGSFTTGTWSSGNVTTNSLTATGGTINGVTIGATTATTGQFTTLQSTGLATLSSLTTSSATISGGTIDGTTIGGTTPAAVSSTSGSIFTTASASGGANFRLPHGAAPTSPVNGDVWSTTSGVFARVNGATIQFLSSIGTVTIGQGGTGQTTALAAFDALKQQATTSYIGVSQFATAAVFRTGTDTTKSLVVDQTWASAAEVTLTDAATIAVDMSTFLNATVTLAGNRTLGNPSNTKVGQTGYIRIVQDGTGSRTLAYSSNWKFASATAPVLTTTASATDMLFYMVVSSTFILGTLVSGVG